MFSFKTSHRRLLPQKARSRSWKLNKESSSTVATYKGDNDGWYSSDSEHSTFAVFRRRRSRVRFCEQTVQVAPSEHAVEFSEVWYTAEDFERIRQDNLNIFEQCKKGCIMEQEYSKRGLEASFRPQLEYLASREEIINNLLDKQIDLWMNQTPPLEHERLLAGAYIVQTRQYALRAMVMGMHDSKGVVLNPAA